MRSFPRVYSVLVAAVVAANVVFSSGAVDAQQLSSIAQTEARLELLSQLNPQAYQAAIAATEQNGVDAEPNIALTRVPESIVSTLDPVIWAALIDHARATNRYLAGNDPDVNAVVSSAGRVGGASSALRVSPGLIRPIWNFIRTNWRIIWGEARRNAQTARRAVWYRANRCAHGAFTGINTAARDLGLQPVDFLVSQPIPARVAAAGGCIAALIRG